MSKTLIAPISLFCLLALTACSGQNLEGRLSLAPTATGVFPLASIENGHMITGSMDDIFRKTQSGAALRVVAFQSKQYSLSFDCDILSLEKMADIKSMTCLSGNGLESMQHDDSGNTTFTSYVTGYQFQYSILIDGNEIVLLNNNHDSDDDSLDSHMDLQTAYSSFLIFAK